MRKELRHELEVATSADSIWEVYGSPDIPRLLRDVLLPGVFERLDVIQGNGGVGTVLDIAFPPGAVPRSYKEKFVKVDHKNRLKEVVMIEGGYLDLGCTFYMDRIHVLPSGPNTCVIKSTLIYEVPDELAYSVASLISVEPLASMAEAISGYVLRQRKMTTNKILRKELTTQMEVATSADSIWAVYGSPDIPRLLRDVLLPGVFEKLDVIEGNGGVGTVLDIAFPPGAVPRFYKEKFVKVDHKNRLKEVVMIEGGYLDLGCTFYMDRIHVIPKGLNSCVIKSTLIYEVPNELADSVSSLISVEPLESMAAVISNYVISQRKMATKKILRRELSTQMEVATSADSIWAVYGSPDIPRLLRDVLLPGVFEKLDVIEGNGGVGTVLDIAFPPGAVPRSYKEKFVEVDHKNRLKEVVMIEGGYLDLGFTFYMDRIHVLPKGANSCVIKSTLIYEVPDELVDSVGSLMSTKPLESMATVISDYVLKQRKMTTSRILRKELTTQMEVATSADSIWAVYGSPDIPRLLRDVLLPGVFEKLDVIEGNGGVGTVLDIAFPPGAVPRTYKEKFVKVDHENRLKEVVMIEGGYLDLGCTFYMDRIHVIPKGPNSCVIKSTLIYEVPNELADSVSSLISVEPLESMAAVISNYVLSQRKMVTKKIMRRELTTQMEVATSADSIWAVYGSPDIPRLLRDVLLPGVFEKLDVIEGNGGVGTVLDIAFPPGAVPRSYKEKFVKVDHKNRLKEVVMIEGGYLDLGCTFYMDRIHVLPKGANSCVIKSTLIYEIPDELVDSVGSLMSTEPLASMAAVISDYVLKQRKMDTKRILKKELTTEMEVATSADSIWAVYGSPDIPRLLRDVLLPGVFEKLDVIEGNGGVGTVLDIAFPPGTVPRSYKEKFVKVDQKNRLKEVVMIEGGYLDLGCTFYMDRIHVLPKSPNSCVIKSTLIYEVPDEFADALGSLISVEPLASMAEVISGYVLKQKKEAKKILKKELTHELEVPTSADSIWAVYGSPDIPRLLRDVLLPGVFEKLDVVEGNGGVGTVLDIAFPPGAVPRSYKEKFVKVDHDKHLKEVVMIEGGYLDLGCTFYMDRIHVLPKGPNSCVIESSLIYEVREELADVVGSLISIEPLASMAEVISSYVLKQQLRVFGVVVQPRVGLSLLLCLILCLVILGGLLIGGVSI